MRILILGDSLPFPRPKKGQPLPTTWPMLLKAELPQADIWLRATPRSCILDTLREFLFFTESLTEFDMVIVQTGIVDCAPRPYPRWMGKMMEIFLNLDRLRAVERFTHRRLLWLYNRPWVGPRQFRKAIRDIIVTAHSNNPRLTTAFIPIAAPSRSILATLPGIDRAADTYNIIILQETEQFAQTHSCLCLDPFGNSDPGELTIEDGHHLSVRGHRSIADAVLRHLHRTNATSHNTQPASP